MNHTMLTEKMYQSIYKLETGQNLKKGENIKTIYIYFGDPKTPSTVLNINPVSPSDFNEELIKKFIHSNNLKSEQFFNIEFGAVADPLLVIDTIKAKYTNITEPNSYHGEDVINNINTCISSGRTEITFNCNYIGYLDDEGNLHGATMFTLFSSPFRLGETLRYECTPDKVSNFIKCYLSTIFPEGIKWSYQLVEDMLYHFADPLNEQWHSCNLAKGTQVAFPNYHKEEMHGTINVERVKIKCNDVLVNNICYSDNLFITSLYDLVYPRK